MRAYRPLLALTLAVSAAGQHIGIDLDPARSEIAFVLGDVLHTVHGTFRLQAGHLDFDLASGAVSGKATVDTASGDSDSAVRDKRMKRDILESGRYPEISFTPNKVTGAFSPSGDSSITIAGLFSIHGQSHEITLPMQVKVSGPDIVGTGSFVVPYVAWGMKNPSTFLLRVNDHVDVSLKAVGKLSR